MGKVIVIGWFYSFKLSAGRHSKLAETAFDKVKQIWPLCAVTRSNPERHAAAPGERVAAEQEDPGGRQAVPQCPARPTLGAEKKDRSWDRDPRRMPRSAHAHWPPRALATRAVTVATAGMVSTFQAS